MSGTVSPGEPDGLEQRTMHRVLWRLMPFLIICYFVAYLDRVNVGFAALSMNKSLHLTGEQFGFGAGFFFIGYALFEIPSNILLYKVGARRWIARIMLTWGIMAAAMAFAQGAYSYNAIRFLLGVSEAGFQPGVLFLVTIWFPEAYRGRVFGLFFAAIPVSGIIGAPISGYLLSLDGFLGLEGWQWLYIIEALPAIALAPIVLIYLQDGPQQAKWLPDDGREWLARRLDAETRRMESKRVYTILQSLYNPAVLFLSAVYFTNVCLNNAVAFFLPQIVKGFGLTNIETGFVSAIPSLTALLAVIFFGRRSDKMKERYNHSAFANGLAGVALLSSALLVDPALRVAALSITLAATLSFAGVFWAIPGTFLTGGSAAGGLAAISAMGIVGGFVSPWFIGSVKDLTGDFRWGLGCVGVLAIIAAFALVEFGRRKTSETKTEIASRPSATTAK